MHADRVAEFLGQEEALILHARLVTGDPVASSDLAAAYLEPLARWLGRREPRSDEDDRYTAAEDTLLELIHRPNVYDPDRGTLETYLHVAAHRDLKNLQRNATRHTMRRADWGAVELSPSQRERIVDTDADPATIVEMNETIEERTRALRLERDAVATGLSPAERAVLALIQTGERRTDAYVAVLGLAHLSLPEQRAEVKRVKDKLKVRLKRSGHD